MVGLLLLLPLLLLLVAKVVEVDQQGSG